MLEHQPRLLLLARRCGCDRDQAADVVQEALLRAATTRQLDLQRLGGLLTVIVRHLVVDAQRRQSLDARCAEHWGLRPLPVPSHEDALCDRAEGGWLREQTVRLPARERDVLLARAAGTAPLEIAQNLGVSVKAVESLAGRARKQLRTVLMSTWAVAFFSIAPLAAGAHPPAPAAHSCRTHRATAICREASN